MSHRPIAVLTLLLFAAPLSAQMKHDAKDHGAKHDSSHASKQKMHDMDHDKKVAGAGALPKGWSGRADGDAKVEETKFAAMGGGWHVTTGPAAIYWRSADRTKGPFTASVTMKQTKGGEHPEAYGIIFMADKLDKADQNYAYFLVRGDGKFLVNHRAGSEVHKIVPWTDNAAVSKADAKGVATNTLTVDASKRDSIRLLVNGKQVHALGGDHFGNTDGIVGLRVNHNLDVHVSDFKISGKK